MTAHILLDTNVVSELMRRDPDPAVLAWFDKYKDVEFVISSIVRSEILLGIALLPDGERKRKLTSAAKAMFEQDFEVCLPFDAKCADTYANLVAERMRTGQPISTEDGQIAAIALASRLPLATRNSKDFSNIAGLTVLNPWEQTP